MEEGEPADTVYWIEEGLVEVATSTADGSTAIVAELGPGRYFSELAALLGTRRTATVTAVKPTTLTLHDTAGFRMRIGAEQTRAPLDATIERVSQLIDGGQYLAAFDAASALMGVGESSPHVRYLAVLALARSGATIHARHQYESLGLDSIDPESLTRSLADDIAVLSARLDKDLALSSEENTRRGWAERAARGYQDAFEASGAHYHAVNAATMWLVAGLDEKAETVATRALDVLQGDVVDYWSLASEAEASLIVGDEPQATAAISSAARMDETSHAARATTLKQLTLVTRLRGINDEMLEPLRNPAVVHYCGHVILPDGANGRFPAHEEGRVAQEFRSTFEQLNVGFGFGSLAAGADILGAEALLAPEADLHVVLPFDQDEFVRT